MVLYPPDYARITKEVYQALPKWIIELPSENYLAELTSRIVLHPDVQKFTNGDAHLIELIETTLYDSMMERMKTTERYAMEVALGISKKGH